MGIQERDKKAHGPTRRMASDDPTSQVSIGQQRPYGRRQMNALELGERDELHQISEALLGMVCILGIISLMRCPDSTFADLARARLKHVDQVLTR